MNVRVFKEEKSNIRTVDFSEHVFGYKQGQHLSERPQSYVHNPNSMNNSHLRCFRKTDNEREKNYANIFLHQQSKIAPANSPEKSSPLFYEQQEELNRSKDQEVQGKDDRQQIVKSKHIQFIRSYQGWLKDTYIDGYRTARMTNSLGVKKTRPSQRSARKEQIIETQFYQVQINQEYKQSNLFPSRKNQSLKKFHRRQQKPFSRAVFKGKNEGQLKMKLLKSTIKSDAPHQQKKRSQQGHRAMSRPQSALLRNFSNPKILMIQNRQLVTGTKIMLV